MVVFSTLGHVMVMAFCLQGNKRLPSSTTAFLRNSRGGLRQSVSRAPQTGLHSHCAVVPPNPSSISQEGSFISEWFTREADTPPVEETTASLENLCALLDATPKDLLRLQSSSDGVRGVYLNRPVRKNDILLRVPLEFSLQDDDPPEWMESDSSSEGQATESSYTNPSDWASRLAASLLDLQLHAHHNTDFHKGFSVWLSMLPDSTFLRASLPVHWTDDVVMSARCTALELAMDSAYFARAEAIEELMSGLKRCELARHLDEDHMRSMCQNALDLVQTRSCRVEPKDGVQWGPPLRILAPVFDFINHGSSNINGEGGANAAFGWEGGEVTDLEGPSLVVRAARDLNADDEVLIDYGESARPSWRCLASYGFVPEYRDGEDGDVAEVYMDGVRYEVGPSTVPCDMVETVSASIQEDESIGSALRSVDFMLDGSLEESDFEDEPWRQQSPEDAQEMLNPAVAVKIAKRLSDVAFQLLLDPDGSEDPNVDADDDPALVRSQWLAASLRWSQHRILLACAMGLRDFVTRRN